MGFATLIHPTTVHPDSAESKAAKTRADKTFKKFRDTLRLAAEDHGTLLELKVDQRRNADPEDRRFWFKTADDSVERITRFNEGVTQGLPAVLETQRVSVQSEGAESGYLLIYARHDRDQALTLHAALAGHLAAGGCDWRMSDWHAIPPGEQPDLVRGGYLSKARLALVLLSVDLIADLKAGRTVLETDCPLVPLALKRIMPDQLEGTVFEDRTVFDGEGDDAWTIHRGSGRDDWTARAAAQILSRIRAQSSLTPAEHDPFAIFERPRLRRMDDCEDAHFVPPFVKRDSDPEGRPAIDFLIDEWLLGADGDVFCAIFSELGMGKTTLCQHLTRDLLERRRTEPGLPLPVYLDLHAVNTMRWDWDNGAPPLEPMLDHMIGTAFNIPVNQGRPGADEIKRLAQQQGGLILFDGLDEVMNRLTPEQCRGFIYNLWSILPPTLWKPPRGAGPDWRRPASVGRLIMTCRSHFFQTLHDQLNALDGQQRERVSRKDYLWVTLLPFTKEQVETYFKQVFSADADQAERIIAMLDQIHDLRALSSRPYNLSLIQDQVDRLEAIQRAGGTIGVADLYEGMIGQWMRRDAPKHRLNRDHKLLLMERLALRLWSRQQRDLSYQALEDWLLDELLAEPRWQLEYSAYLNRTDGPGILKEDLRNATFIVREGEDRFRFAHTSIMEFFLARALHRALVEDWLDQWAVPVPSPEALDFLGGLIATRETNASLDALARIRSHYRHRISELALAYALRAHAQDMSGAVFARLQLQGAELRFQHWQGRADRPMIWQGADLSGARLDGCRFDDIDLSDGRLDGANLSRTLFDRCRLDHVTALGANLTGSVFYDCPAAGANYGASRLYHSQWLGPAPAGIDGEPPALFTAREASVPPRAEPCSVSGHAGSVRAVCVDPQGRWLASAGVDGSVRLWDADSGAERHCLLGHRGLVLALAVDPQGRWLASAGGDGSVRLWDADSGAERHRLSGHRGRVQALAVDPQGHWLASAGRDGSMRLWDADSGVEHYSLSGLQGWVLALAVNPQGCWLASAGMDGSVRLWDADSGAERRMLSGHQSLILALAIDPQGRWLASAGVDGSVRLWTMQRSGKTPVCEIAFEHLPEAGWVVWRDPDGPNRRWVHWSRNAWRWLRWHAPLPNGRHWMHYPMDAFRGRQEGDG